MASDGDTIWSLLMGKTKPSLRVQLLFAWVGAWATMCVMAIQCQNSFPNRITDGALNDALLRITSLYVPVFGGYVGSLVKIAQEGVGQKEPVSAQVRIIVYMIGILSQVGAVWFFWATVAGISYAPSLPSNIFEPKVQNFITLYLVGWSTCVGVVEFVLPEPINTPHTT